ncbi:hypothetical protein JCM18694_31520 [Prolixibacter denitrificans]|uniref:Uncharacterized protein n=1 Tax=Prolixibacter denitrificans TaxID=1541063 RepID=A0ABQ0ZNE1_9BACT|nr:hypothetical protein JCM18694_31520 [Prolixibacter denitrificans]
MADNLLVARFKVCFIKNDDVVKLVCERVKKMKVFYAENQYVNISGGG